jgi:nanoRNase/pAp phosphatase (c-di-AMP/oligoRNAs hydrolase)
VVIDHHHGDDPKHALTIKDSESMSTAELVFEYAYTRWPKLFDAQIATYLYM